MKRRYKVMSLTFPFSHEKEFWEECVKEQDKIIPVFNRNGYFFDRLTKIAWLEINGEAWKYGNWESFKFDLDINQGNNRIHPTVYVAIKTLMSQGLASKKQREIHYIEWMMRQLRSTYLNARKWKP